MAHQRFSHLDLRRHGISRPAALAVVAVLSLNMIHASAWASSALTTVAGGGSAGAPGFGGDGGPATAAQLNSPSSVAVDSTGNVFVADTANHRIRRIDVATGIITTVAGGAKDGGPGFAGDGGKAGAAQLNSPAGVAVDSTGSVFVSDSANQRVRRIDSASGIITTVAGGAKDGAPGFAGDGGKATKAQLSNPTGLAVDGAANVFVADTGNQRIRRIDAATGVITTVAGGAAKGAPGFAGDGGPAGRAQLSGPSGVAIDGAGNLLIADTANQRVRRIDAQSGILTTIAGGAADGAPGFGGDGGPATAAQLDSPAGVAVDGGGNVTIADTANQRVRRLDAQSGILTTLAGGADSVATGTKGDPATPPGLVAPGPLVARGPLGVAVDRSGAALIANSPRNRIDRAVADTAPTPPNGVAPPAQPTDPASLCRLVEEGAATPTSTSPSWMTRSVSVSTSTATPGQQLGVQGNGFGSGQQLTVTLCSVPTMLGSVTADTAGSYRTDVKIPTDAAPGAHHLVLSDVSGNAAVALRVVLPSRGGAGLDGGAGTDQGLSDTGATGTGDPSQDSPDPDLTDPTTGDQFGADPGGVSIASPDTGSVNTGATDANGMPITGGEFSSLLFMAGASLKVGGALVLAGRKRSPRR